MSAADGNLKPQCSSAPPLGSGLGRGRQCQSGESVVTVSYGGSRGETHRILLLDVRVLYQNNLKCGQIGYRASQGTSPPRIGRRRIRDSSPTGPETPSGQVKWCWKAPFPGMLPTVACDGSWRAPVLSSANFCVLHPPSPSFVCVYYASPNLMHPSIDQ
eukprot:scaffold698_cov397-Pinguiococcus_pyrenoidosus.AAC.1